MISENFVNKINYSQSFSFRDYDYLNGFHFVITQNVDNLMQFLEMNKVMGQIKDDF